VSAAVHDLRVRSDNAAIVALIEEANQRSATFHRLLDTLNASDGIVLIQEGDCPHGERACFVNVTMAGARRVMWVKVQVR